MSNSVNIGDLIRENIRQLIPYSSARDEFSGTASVFLDANENPHNTPLNRYPDPKQTDLKRVIAGLRGQEVDNLFLGNGSDEGIDLLFRVLCDPGRDNVVTVDPTYGMYGVCARINQVERKSVLLSSDFRLEPDKVLKAVDMRTKMIFMCSPNNPTSNSLELDAMMQIIDAAKCMVVVDEAYIDFSREPGVLDRIPEKKNLVVLQTLSKSWGLAGIRLGMVFAHPQLIGFLAKVKYPYNLNTLTLQKAKKSLADPSAHNHWIQQILSEREKLIEKLDSFSFVKEVFPTDANFLLAKMENPVEVYAYLMDKGIIVRDRSKVPLCAGCLRITVGTREENQLLMEALTAYDQSIKNR